MFAAVAVVAFIIGLIVATHDLQEPTFWLFVGLLALALHATCVFYVQRYNRHGQG